MHIFDFYRDSSKHSDLTQLFTVAAQQHPDGLPDFFLEKDIWVTEILRLLYDEQLLGNFAVAFKGGTALSKCWKAIDRFSEDIDLSIHWADLAGVEDEPAAWAKTTQSGNQQAKFRKQQRARMKEWAGAFLQRLNLRLSEYGISGLAAKFEADSNYEKIQVAFPKMTEGTSQYHLDDG